jgi:hypothetical protein
MSNRSAVLRRAVLHALRHGAMEIAFAVRFAAFALMAGGTLASIQCARADVLHSSRGENVRRPQIVTAEDLAADPAAAQPGGDDPLNSQTNLFSGSASADFSVNVPGPGDLLVQLSSINVGSWVDANLSLSLNSASSLLGSASGVTGSDLLSPLPVSGPETVFVNLTGQATGSLDLGLYSVNVVFEPQGTTVPLPGALVLLLSGLVGILGGARLGGVFALAGGTHE